MKLRSLSVFLDLLFLVVSVADGSDGLFVVAVAVLAVVGVLVVFGAVVLAVALCDQRKPPYPMHGAPDA